MGAALFCSALCSVHSHDWPAARCLLPAAPLPPYLHPPLQVVGLVEEWCNQTSLHSFLARAYGAQQQQQLRPLWTLGHLASEFAALMDQVGAAFFCGVCGGCWPAAPLLVAQPARLPACLPGLQVGRMDELGICHQDINLSNIMVGKGQGQGRRLGGGSTVSLPAAHEAARQPLLRLSHIRPCAPACPPPQPAGAPARLPRARAAGAKVWGPQRGAVAGGDAERPQLDWHPQLHALEVGPGAGLSQAGRHWRDGHGHS